MNQDYGTDLRRRFEAALGYYQGIMWRGTVNCGVYFLHGTEYLALNPELLEEACRRSPAVVMVVFNKWDLENNNQKELFQALRELPHIGYTKCKRTRYNTLHVFTIPTQEAP